ncbi:unnamed protein product [Arabis nemorensis]|uniref:Uncharacterized protein n=1 Tax=Arabis nemorensis TaxID=586526 RepID=A0A565BQS5_9BRAS|nr:unnamed protein product [Arabis nemorensis]
MMGLLGRSKLEPSPVISIDLNKGKGLVFGFENQDTFKAKDKGVKNGQRLLDDAIRSGVAMRVGPLVNQTQSEQIAGNFVGSSSGKQACSTVFRAGNSDAGSSGTSKKTRKPRRRPNRAVRNKSKVNDGQLLEVMVKQAPKKLFGNNTVPAVDTGDRGFCQECQTCKRGGGLLDGTCSWI